jgi:hypothetical protein
MENAIGQIYVIQSTNLTTQQVVIGKARFSLQDAVAIVETANNTEDAWFYEMVACST